MYDKIDFLHFGAGRRIGKAIPLRRNASLTPHIISAELLSIILETPTPGKNGSVEEAVELFLQGCITGEYVSKCLGLSYIMLGEFDLAKDILRPLVEFSLAHPDSPIRSGLSEVWEKLNSASELARHTLIEREVMNRKKFPER